MAQSKFTIYKYVKLKNGSWRYCRAAFYSNGKIKPNRRIVGGKEDEHTEGAYYLHHKKQWILVGTGHWKHNASGMPGSTPRSSSVCEERLRRRTRLCKRHLIGSRCQRLPRSISRTARNADWTPGRSASTAPRLNLSSSNRPLPPHRILLGDSLVVLTSSQTYSCAARDSAGT